MAQVESVLVHLAVQHISSKIKEGSKAIVKIKYEADDLLSELEDVNKVQIGGEGRAQLIKSYEFRSSIGELIRIAYEAEDAVDTLVSKTTALSFLSLYPGTHEASKKLRILKERTIEVKSKLDKHAEGSPKGLASRSQDPKGHLHADGDHVIGIEQEIKRVVDQLTGKHVFNDGESSPENRLAIVGMGGSGKTTLARSIYNHKAVKKHFHFHAWVSFSQGWDTSSVLLDILKQIWGQRWFSSFFDNDDEQLEHEPYILASMLNNILYKKTCLLVLDDVWNLKSLHEFIDLIQEENYPNTYTIVITSRQMPPSHIKWCIRKPNRLTDENSWKLFSLVASNPSKALSSEYEALGKEMLRKCEGLPLAIVALGRLLKTKDSKSEWQRVVYQMTGKEATSMYGPVNEILGLSYDELPYYLKPCFLYLGLFPEGSAIPGGPLIRMWIAEGFIKPDGTETLEAAGRRYLQELIDHTMVDVVSKTHTDKVKAIRIHDIMRDFCILKGKELDFLTISSSDPEAIGKTSRRAAVNLSKRFILPTDNLNLRSLTLFEKSSTNTAPEKYTQRYLNMTNICQMNKLLRVLEIVGIKSPDGTLPREIGDLIHLTYLRIRSTNIRKLPKSIGKLSNLLTLDYWDVSNDIEVKVPNVLWKLEKLRHLYLPTEMSGTVEDLKLHTLKNLITLWGVGGGYWMQKEMDKFISPLGRLYIHRISNEDQLKAVLDCSAMKENSCLYSLSLDWYSFEFKNLAKLLAKQSLKKLRLSGKASDSAHNQQLEFPAELGKLELCYTELERPETMVLIEKLGFLKVLKLSKDSYKGAEWSCGKNSFPVLEELKLINLPNLEQWEVEEGGMPCLKKLSIVSCTKLKSMPEGLRLVQSLEELAIERMPYNFISRLQNVQDWEEETGGEDFHIIKHIPHLKVRDSCPPQFY